MAGKRQHYVPRLLQRGFLADPAEGAERTWLHRPGAPARLVGIRDVGVEDWFYSRRSSPGEQTLDDAITDFERDLGEDVAMLRNAAPETQIDPVLAARTVVHLVMRTAHLRRTISTGVTSVTNEIEALFTSSERLGAMLGLTSPMLASAVVDAIRNSAQEMVPRGFPAPLSERLLTFFMRELGDQLVNQAVATLAPLFPNMRTGLADQVRDTHNALVGKPLNDHGWVAALSAFSWSVEAATDLILPDAVALAREVGNSFTPLLFTSGANAAVVLLPVAHNRMLFGRRNPKEPVDLSTFNTQAAASCEGFFIAARSFDAGALNSRIGTGSAQTLADSIAEAVRHAEEASSLAPSALPAAQPRHFEQQDFSYSVTLHDFGDDVLAQEYGEILQTVIAALARDIPLYDLDGITIAVGYNDALAKLDRGDPDLLSVASGALGYGIGVAMPVTVARDGKHKEHLVLAAGIAEGWTSDDPVARARSLHILIKMLAGIAHATRYADAPGFMPDPIARELQLAVVRTPSGYWSAKQAAFVALDEGRGYADLVIDSFQHAKSAIEGARGRMVDDSDVDEAWLIALECVSAVLGHAADWIGHRDGLADDQAFDGSDLPARLAAYGLEHWISLFGRDLAVCYTDEAALDLTVVSTLSRHVERLFWSLGIYCWPEGEDVRCVVSDRPLLSHVLHGATHAR